MYCFRQYEVYYTDTHDSSCHFLLTFDFEHCFIFESMQAWNNSSKHQRWSIWWHGFPHTDFITRCLGLLGCHLPVTEQVKEIEWAVLLFQLRRETWKLEDVFMMFRSSRARSSKITCVDQLLMLIILSCTLLPLIA